MKWKYETRDQKIERLDKWRKWFAWRPVWIDGTGYWLEYVERRDFVWLRWIDGDAWLCEYRPLKASDD